jgi:hypothetical protein
MGKLKVIKRKDLEKLKEGGNSSGWQAKYQVGFPLDQYEVVGKSPNKYTFDWRSKYQVGWPIDPFNVDGQAPNKYTYDWQSKYQVGFPVPEVDVVGKAPDIMSQYTIDQLNKYQVGSPFIDPVDIVRNGNTQPMMGQNVDPYSGIYKDRYSPTVNLNQVDVARNGNTQPVIGQNIGQYNGGSFGMIESPVPQSTAYPFTSTPQNYVSERTRGYTGGGNFGMINSPIAGSPAYTSPGSTVANTAAIGSPSQTQAAGSSVANPSQGVTASNQRQPETANDRIDKSIMDTINYALRATSTNSPMGFDLAGNPVFGENSMYNQLSPAGDGTFGTESLNGKPDYDSNNPNKDPQAAQATQDEEQQQTSLPTANAITLNGFQSADLASKLQMTGAFAKNVGLFNQMRKNAGNNAAQIGAARTGQIASIIGTAAAGTAALADGARNLMAGFSSENMAEQLRRAELEKALRKKAGNETIIANGGRIQVRKFADGGKLGDLTGEYTRGLPEELRQYANAEVEGGEYIQLPDGTIAEVKGGKHSQGGVPVNVEGYVTTNRLQIGGEYAKKLRSEYGLNVKAADTFASVLDKYKSKSGLKKAYEEQETYLNKLEKNEDKVKDKPTSDLNKQYLSGKIHETEQRIHEIEPSFQSFAKIVYNMQEASKGAGDEDFFFGNGGLLNSDAFERVRQEHGLTRAEAEKIVLKNGGELKKILKAGGAVDKTLELQKQQRKAEEELAKAGVGKATDPINIQLATGFVSADMTELPPNMVQRPTLNQVNFSRINPALESYNNPQLGEMQYNAMNQLGGLPANQQAAAAALIAGQIGEKSNDYFANVSRQNIAAQQQADAYNAQVRDKAALTNLQLAQQWEQLSQITNDNYYNELANYWGNASLHNAQRLQDERNYDLLNSMVENYKLNGNGSIGFNGTGTTFAFDPIAAAMMQAERDKKNGLVGQQPKAGATTKGKADGGKIRVVLKKTPSK